MPKAKKAAPKRILKLVKTAPKKAAPKKVAKKMTAPLKKAGKKVAMAAPKKKQAPKVTPKKMHVGNNPMWKLLEMKENRRKQAAEEAHSTQPQNKYSGYGTKMPSQHSKFSRFAGPRRRAA